jgi:hypothetical protein
MQIPGKEDWDANSGTASYGPSSQYWVVDDWENGGANSLQGKSYNTYNNDGSLVKSGVVDWAGNVPWKDALKNFALVAGAGLAAGGLAGASAGGAGAGGTGAAGATTAGASGGSGLYGLGSATGGASGGLGLSAGGSGLGLSAATGSGLSLAAPAAGSLGGGLGLTAGAGALGTIGTTGLAAGAGSLLGSNALSGTYTLANGTTIPLSTSAAGNGLTLGQVGNGVKTGAGLLNAINGTGGSGGGLGGNLGQIIAGAIDADRQGKASDKILEWLKSRTDITDNLYKPGTPEYNQLWDEMSRKDAAAGRNSQYGPRSVELAAKIAQIKSAENTKMTTGIGQWMKGAYDQDASKYSGLMAGLGGSGTSGGGLIDMITKYYNGTNSMGNTVYDTTTDTGGWSDTSLGDFFYGNGTGAD